jgi:hypoxanthine-guanine phosphoribosyltransferase
MVAILQLYTLRRIERNQMKCVVKIHLHGVAEGEMILVIADIVEVETTIEAVGDVVVVVIEDIVETTEVIELTREIKKETTGEELLVAVLAPVIAMVSALTPAVTHVKLDWIAS